ncbi:hypothetical protein BsWGS_25808 [Bradybaena similaris]
MSAKSVCVVGAGVAGVAALKECVRQGFHPVCYELDSDIGGIWRRKDYTKPTNTPAIYKNLVMNTSKFNSCYSDFPPLHEDTPYQSADGMFQYLKRAIQHFDLEKYIHFNTRVIKIRKTSDHDTTGRWEVFTAKRGDDIAGDDLAGPRGDDLSLSRCHREVFDFVFVCAGYFKLPIYPDIPGMETFKGTVQHSFNYTSPTCYDEQNVLVVGKGLTAIDVASDIGHLAKQVYIAMADGTWIIPRCHGKVPAIDMLFTRDILHSEAKIVKLNDLLIKLANARLDHESSGIRPTNPPLFSGIAACDDIQLQILSGRVKTYEGLARMEGDKAHFTDGQIVSGIDAVVFCTGYSPDLSFLDVHIIDDDGKMELYKMIFPLHEKHHTLALIGCFGADGPLAVCLENAARLATRVMAGKHTLPSREEMKKDIDHWNTHTFIRRGNYKSYFLNAQLLSDSTAYEIGCYPSFWKIFFRDPVLAFRSHYGSPYAAHYRLLGPDSQWEQVAHLCRVLYDEGSSSVRHRQPRKFQRPDVYQYNIFRSIRLLVVSSVIAAFGCLAYKYNSAVNKLMLGWFA